MQPLSVPTTQLSAALSESEKNTKYVYILPLTHTQCHTPVLYTLTLCDHTELCLYLTSLCSLAAEYHKVYELQRKRLRESVGELSWLVGECVEGEGVRVCDVCVSVLDKLRWERDVWQGAAYGLAGEVTEQLLLRTLRRLQLGEKTWVTLARHFATLLASTNIQQVYSISIIYIVYHTALTFRGT